MRWWGGGWKGIRGHGGTEWLKVQASPCEKVPDSLVKEFGMCPENIIARSAYPGVGRASTLQENPSAVGRLPTDVGIKAHSPAWSSPTASRSSSLPMAPLLF